MPKLSIIIPTFNSKASIEACLNSITTQTFRDYEIVVQDGGSSDGTAEKVKSFQTANSGVDLKLFSEKDEGPYDAMNRGVRRAGGEWLYFLGSDDEFYRADVLESIFVQADIEHAGVVYGNVLIAGEVSWAKDNSIYDGRFDLEKILSRNICHQAVFYRTVFHKSIGEYNIKYPVCADWDFNLRCWSKRPFTYVNVIVAKFCAGGISSTQADQCFGQDFARNVFEYFHLSLDDPLLNTPRFAAYGEVVRMQQSRAPLRRAFRRIREAVRGRRGLAS